MIIIYATTTTATATTTTTTKAASLYSKPFAKHIDHHILDFYFLLLHIMGAFMSRIFLVWISIVVSLL